MKKIIFIDNDHQAKAEKDFKQQSRFKLVKSFGLNRNDIDSNHEIISGFRKLSRKEKMDILFQRDVIIVTWSMYTFTHCNSLGQLEYWLKSAGENDLKGLIYLDTSANIIEALDRILTNSKHGIAILSAISNNYILTLDYDKCKYNGEDYRRVTIAKNFNYYEDLVEAVPFKKSEWNKLLTVQDYN